MEENSIFKTLLKFTWPLIITGILQQLYTMVDLLVVGNFVDSDAMSAIGCAIPVNNLVLAVITGIMTGCSILVSNYYGNGEQKAIREVITTHMVSMAVFGAILTSVSYQMIDPVLKWLNTQPGLLDLASSYLKILFLGIPFVIIHNFIGAVLKSLGDSKSLLYALIITSIINIFLNIYCVIRLKMGVNGVAAATVCAQAMAAFFLIFVFLGRLKKMGYQFRISDVKPDWLLYGFRLEIPVMMQMTLASVIQMMMQGVANSLGMVVVTAISAAYRIDTLIIVPIRQGVQSILVYVSQNIGAGRKDTAQKVLKSGCKIFAGYAFAASLLMVLTGKRMLESFGIGPDAVSVGYSILCKMALFYMVLAVYESLCAYLQANEDVLFCAVCYLSCLMIRYILARTFSPAAGSDMLAYAENCSWALGAVICAIRYKTKWKIKKEKGA